MNDHQPAFLLTPEEFAATRQKIEKLQRRAEKRGFNGTVTLTGELVRREVTGPGGVPLNLAYYACTITGSAPCYEGWEFVAAVDAVPAEDGSIGWIIRCAPGRTEDGIDRSLLRPGRCDHCGTVRQNRRKTFLVRHQQEGTWKQVGSTCMKDFLGWNTSPVWIDPERELAEAAERSHAASSVWTPDTVFLAASATVAVHGWAPASSDGIPTARRVRALLEGTTSRSDEELIAGVADRLPELREQAAKDFAEALARASEGRGGGGYVANLHTALNAEHVEHRTFALICSAVSYLARERQRDAERHAKEENASQLELEWLGELGEKITVTGEVTTCLLVDGFMPDTTQMLIIITTPNALVKLSTAARWSYDLERGMTVTVTGTVKKHAEYEGRKQTVLVRPKLDAGGTDE